MLYMLSLLADILGFYLVSAVFVKDPSKFAFTKLFSSFALYVLIITMGLRMGANEEVTGNIGTIGLQALIITIMAIAGSMIVAYIASRIMRMNKQGLLPGEAEEREEAESSQDTGNSAIKSSLVILLLAALGIFLGFAVVPRVFSDMDAFQNGAANVITVMLYILLASVGFDLGLEGGLGDKMKAIGLRVLVLPLCINIGTLGMGLIYGLFSSFSMRESLAIFAGFGWYSLAPAIIINAGFIKASAVSFLHNVLREVFSFLLIPVVAEKISYYVAIAIPAAPGMDVCIPIVKKCTNAEMVLYSLISGIITSSEVSILVTLFIGA